MMPTSATRSSAWAHGFIREITGRCHAVIHTSVSIPMKSLSLLTSTSASLILIGLATLAAQARDVRVTIENLGPVDGALITPVWVGFHDGTFDLYDRGASAALFPGLESLAEDGNTGPLSARFSGSGAGAAQATILGPTIPPIAPGETASMVLALDAMDPKSRYFSYASMVIPSNDAFVANGNPMAHEIFDASGNFLGAQFMILGNQVLDAGTEVNDELSNSTAFFGQAVANTGVDQNGVVDLHAGLNAAGTGGIVDGMFNGFAFANANFANAGYRVARITVSSVPDAGGTFSMATAAFALLGAMARRFRVRGN